MMSRAEAMRPGLPGEAPSQILSWPGMPGVGTEWPTRPAVGCASVGVEELVAAGLRVRLREHGERGVGGAAADGAVGALEVFDLGAAQRQAELGIRLFQLADGHPPQRPRWHVLEQAGSVVEG